MKWSLRLLEFSIECEQAKMVFYQIYHSGQLYINKFVIFGNIRNKYLEFEKHIYKLYLYTYYSFEIFETLIYHWPKSKTYQVLKKSSFFWG